MKDAQGQDWGRDSRKRDVHSEGAGAGDAGRRGVGITGLAPLGVGGGLSVPCVRSFPGYLPFHTRQVRRDGWSGASRVVRRHRAACSRPCPPTPHPEVAHSGSVPVSETRASAAGRRVLCVRCHRGGSEDCTEDGPVPLGHSPLPLAPQDGAWSRRTEVTCAFHSDSSPSRNKVPRGGWASPPAFVPPQNGRGPWTSQPAALRLQHRLSPDRGRVCVWLECTSSRLLALQLGSPVLLPVTVPGDGPTSTPSAAGHICDRTLLRQPGSAWTRHWAGVNHLCSVCFRLTRGDAYF